jgi:hypothetical protein
VHLRWTAPRPPLAKWFELDPLAAKPRIGIGRLIRARTGEGEHGPWRGGRRWVADPKLTPNQQREAIRRARAGETLAGIGRSYNVSGAAISRLRP